MLRCISCIDCFIRIWHRNIVHVALFNILLSCKYKLEKLESNSSNWSKLGHRSFRQHLLNIRKYQMIRQKKTAYNIFKNYLLRIFFNFPLFKSFHYLQLGTFRMSQRLTFFVGRYKLCDSTLECHFEHLLWGLLSDLPAGFRYIIIYKIYNKFNIMLLSYTF